MSQNCGVPGCGRVAPGSFNDFCPDHHFQIPKAYTDLVRKTRIAAFHADDATKQHLEEQCAGYARLAASKVPGAARMSGKISILGQLAEVEREIAMRRNVYPRQVASNKMRQSEADLLIARMEAVRQTLIFCHNNEADIRAFIAAKREAKSS